MWKHACTGGASFVYVWVDGIAYNQITWNTDAATTFGDPATANSFSVNAAANELYIVRTTTDPDVDPAAIEVSKPSASLTYPVRWLNCGYWNFNDLEWRGGQGGLLYIENTTAATLFDEIVVDRCRMDRFSGIGIRIEGADVTSRQTLTVRDSVFQDVHPLSTSDTIHCLNAGGATAGHVLMIERNRFLRVGHGIRTGATGNWCSGTIRRNFFYDCEDDCIYADVHALPGGSSLNIYSNIMLHCGDDGIEFVGATNVHCWNNTIIDSSDIGLHLDGTDASCSSKNNLVANSRRGFNEIGSNNDAEYTAGVVVDYNLYYNDAGYRFDIGGVIYTTFATYQGDVAGLDPAGLATNPLFVTLTPKEAGDVRLQANSPARAAGVAVGLTEDFFGTPIPQGAAPSIGAVEYTATRNFAAACT